MKSPVGEALTLSSFKHMYIGIDAAITKQMLNANVGIDKSQVNMAFEHF